MKKIIYLAGFSCMVLLQGCFEIIEQVLVKNDGSGNFQLVVNMSKSKTKLNSVMKMKTANGHKVPGKSDITQKVSEIERIIKLTPGLSQMKTSIDFTNYIATVSCTFSAVSSLNTAIKNIAEKEKSHDRIEDIYGFDREGRTFSRLNKFLIKDEYQKMSNADKEIFATANYTSIFRFETAVENTSNKQSRISANNKAVMLKLNALDILTNKKSIENKIKLAK